MALLKTIAVSFSMFSAIPMPQFTWDKSNMRYALCAFPLIGAVIGAACTLWVWFCRMAGLPDLLRGAFLCLIPVLITGGIHLDGYADTCDALASHQSPEKKQEILSDPHIGSFAVIRLCGYFVLMLALWTCLPEYRTLPVLLLFCLSRTQSGLAVAAFPLAKETGLARSFADAADRKRVKVILTALDIFFSALLCFCGAEGFLMAAAAHLVFLYYYHMCMHQFGGLSGDLAGWFLVQDEKWMLIAFAAAEWGRAFL